MKPKTLYDKLWDMHEVTEMKDGTSLLYIDRHILHEVTSAQAFEGLRENNRKPWRVIHALQHLTTTCLQPNAKPEWRGLKTPSLEFKY